MAPKKVKSKKKPSKVIKMQVAAGQASPASVGSSLGPHGVSSPQFCKQFNDATANIEAGMRVPVIVSIYSDRTFSFITKNPPASVLIKKELALDKGSSESNRDKVAVMTKEQLRRIATIKLPDLNTRDIEAAERIIAGTARSMGVSVEQK